MFGCGCGGEGCFFDGIDGWEEEGGGIVDCGWGWGIFFVVVFRL